jgi:hypothetical protein
MNKWIAVLAVAAVAAVGFGGVMYWRHRENTRGGTKRQAIEVCQAVARERLRSPSTAKFPKWDNKEWVKVEQKGDKFRVETMVDAQNGFGAMIRRAAICHIVKNGKRLEVRRVEFGVY